MSKPDKHTPLCPEELFKLLEDHSGKATDFDGMDEFEKEALEGFSKFSTPEKAMAMVEEVNLAVSKKAASGAPNGSVTKTEDTGTTKRNRFIWFSAAASIVLLVIVSVFFLNQSKEDTASNVALNDLTPPAPAAQSTIATPDATVMEEVTTDEKNSVAEQVATASGKAERKAGFKQDQANRLENQREAKPVLEPATEVAFAGTKAPEESEHTTVTVNTNNTYTYKGNAEAKDLDVLKKNEFETSDKLAAAKPVAVSTKNQTETANGYYAPASGNTNSIASTTAIEQNTNAKYDDRIVAEKAGKEREELLKERTDKKSKAKEKTPAYASQSEMDQEVVPAYYKGGELAIKEYVVNHLQKKQVTVTGKYKVKATVLTNGSLKVKSVNHISPELCRDCEGTVKKALDEMTGWIPATWGNTASESSVEFILSF